MATVIQLKHTHGRRAYPMSDDSINSSSEHTSDHQGALNHGDKKEEAKMSNVVPLQEKTNDYWISCLIKVAKTHDQAAFQELFNHFGPKLKTFYISQHLSSQESEELVQETFISVWKYANYFEANKGYVSTWIYTIARNKKLDYYRKTNRQVSTVELVTDDWAVDAGDQFSSQLGGELVEFLPQLTHEQQEVIQKVYFEELSHQKAADALNITLGTVKGRLRSGIKLLNQLMRGDQS